MKPIERFQALLDGKKIRKRSWLSDEFISLKKEGIYRILYTTIQAEPLDANDCELYDDNGDNWELYEEPLPEIKLTPEDVGKRVRLRRGDIAVLTLWDKYSNLFHSLIHTWNEFGKHNSNLIKVYQDRDKDIVEVLS